MSISRLSVVVALVVIDAGGCGSSSNGLPAGAGGSVASGGQNGAPGGSGGAGVSGSGGRGVTGSGGAGATTSTGGAMGTGGAGGATTCTPPAAEPAIGWAAVAGMGLTGTTGGQGATPQTVTTAAALTAAARGTAAAIIYVSGVLGPANVSIGSNKTIVGLCGAELHGHVAISGSSNVIVRNLKIVGYGVGNCTLDPDFDPAVGCSSGADAMTIQNSAHHVLIDHCDISDGTDGNLDIVSAADFVTVSWTKFHYTPRTDTVGADSTGANGHRFSNLIGSDDNIPTDVGHLNVTWHHDWWAENVNQRMPRSRYGQIHLFNNLFTSTGDSYCTNAGLQTHLLVESNVYVNVTNPLQPDSDGDMLARNNLFQMTRGTTTATGAGFVPTYAYTPEATATLAATIMAQAGPH